MTSVQPITTAKSAYSATNTVGVPSTSKERATKSTSHDISDIVEISPAAKEAYSSN